MSAVITDVSIEDGTFILKNGDTTINLIQCDKIPNRTTKGTITISCKVAGEVKENKYSLILGGDSKKIDGITPLVSGETSFSGEDKNSSSSNGEDKNSSSSNGEDENSSSSNNCKLIWELMIIALVSLF